MTDHPLKPKGIGPTSDDIGRAVVYRTAPNFEAEPGIISSVTEHYVFVRYCKSIRGVATAREDLDWAHPKETA